MQMQSVLQLISWHKRFLHGFVYILPGLYLDINGDKMDCEPYPQRRGRSMWSSTKCEWLT